MACVVTDKVILNLGLTIEICCVIDNDKKNSQKKSV